MKANSKRKQSNLFLKLVDDWGLLFLLTIAAYLGNFFYFHLFFGADFLFGGIAIWLIVWRYGLFWGTVASLIASFHTFILWDHPYAIIIFTLETIIVSFFGKRYKSNLIILDGIYWLIIGMPLVWIFYRGVMSISNISTLLILLKQPINGLFNSLIASLIIDFIPHIFHKLNFKIHQKTLSLRQVIFNILVSFIFFPALIFMIFNGQEVLKQIESEITHDLIANKVSTVHLVEQWHNNYNFALKEVGIFLEHPQSDFTSELKLLLKTFSDFKSIIFVRQNNSQEISLSFRTFLIVSQKFNPEYSCTIESGTFIDDFLYFKAPISLEGNSTGCVLGKVNANHLRKIIKPVNNEIESQISLLDNHQKLIVSNQSSQNLVNFEQGRRQSINDKIFQWFPKENGLPQMIYWSKSLYFIEDTVNSEIPWRLRVLIPAKNYFYLLQRRYILNFILMLILSLAALVISWFISHILVKPLSNLAKITNDLPKQLFANLDRESYRKTLKSDLLQSPIIEIDALINNFNNMSEILSQKVQEIYQINQTLSDKTIQLLETNRKLESRTILLQETKEAAEVANRTSSNC